MRSWMVLLAVLASTSSSAARVAVLAVPGDDAAALALAAQVGEQMREMHDDVLDAAVLSRRLRGPVGPPVDIATQRAAIAAAEEAFNALDHERSVLVLDGVIQQLENDQDFSVEKADLLQQTRLTCAQRLLGLAGPAEAGNGETKNGARARVHLANVLRARPSLVLDVSRYPPKMRSLLERATDDVRQAGQGGLTVLSVPAGAAVVVEGRVLGLTPLTLQGVLPAGPHRLWLEKSGRRSITRVIDVQANVLLPVEIDLGFEGALVPVGPGLSPAAPFPLPTWQHLAGFVDVDVVVAVGVEEGAVWGLAVEAAGGLRQGKVPAAVDKPEVVLAAYLRGRSDAGVVAGLPSSIFAQAPIVTDAEPPEETGFPWGLAGVGVGAAVVVSAVVVGGILYATRQVNGTIGVSFGDPP